jgi:O-antigen/teichoic acid export membrane protein
VSGAAVGSTSRPRRPAALPLLVGLVVQAGTTYLVLILAGRSLGPIGFAALSSLYLLITSVATGLFTPLEQEVTRRRAVERARGTWDDTLTRRALTHGLGAAALAVGLALAAYPLTVQTLGDRGWLVVSLCLALPGYAAWFAVRGELAGQGRLQRYAAQLVVDGSFRLVGALVMVATDQASTAGFGLLFGLSPWVALAATLPGWRLHHEQRAAGAPEPLTRPLTLLVVSALAAQLLINAGPLVVSLLATDAERDEAGVYLAVLVVVRIPVFLFSAVQPGYLRALSEHIGLGERAEFDRLVRRVLAAVVTATVVLCASATAVAPPLVSWLFDFDQELSRTTCLLLTLSVGLFLASVVIAQGLLALGHHLWVTTGWLLGLAGLVVGTFAFAGEGVVTRATMGLLIGAVVATVGLALLLQRERGRRPGVPVGDTRAG